MKGTLDLLTRVAPNLYRQEKTGKYYARKKVRGRRKIHCLHTTDRKLAERRLRDWLRDSDAIDATRSDMTLRALLELFKESTKAKAENTRATDLGIIHALEKTWHIATKLDIGCRVLVIRASHLKQWLAHESKRLSANSYNRYTFFLKQLFDLAKQDHIIAESPYEIAEIKWKRVVTKARFIPSEEDLEAIILAIRSNKFNAKRDETADFVEFLGKAGVGQAEAGGITWPDVDWFTEGGRMRFLRHKTRTIFYVPIYPHLRPLLERRFATAKDTTGRVFQIRNAKKALQAATKRLGMRHYTASDADGKVCVGLPMSDRERSRTGWD